MPIDLKRAVGGATELWVSDKTYAVGEQVVSPSDLCVYIRKVTGAGATDPASDGANWQPFGGRAIKSIQRGVIRPTSGTSSVTVSAVNPAKAELRLLSTTNWSPSSSSSDSFAPHIRLSDPVTILLVGFYYYDNGNKYPQVSWELTEYY